MTHTPHDKRRSSSGVGGSPAVDRATVEHLLRHACPGWVCGAGRLCFQVVRSLPRQLLNRFAVPRRVSLS
eukprot:10266541-Alexandrium_andersonii.AAC.1